MTVISRLVFVVALAASAIPVFAQSAPTAVYLRSNVNQPWGQTTNEDAMDTSCFEIFHGTLEARR